MAIQQLRLENFRHLHRQILDLSDGFNYLVGINGAGKTSVLESIYVLSHGRSFRSAATTAMIRLGETRAQIRAEVEVQGQSRSLAWCRDGAGTQVHLDQQPCRLSDLARQMAHAHIDTDTHRLLASGASHRRQWLDWALFHVEPRYGDVWRQYRQALQQRNAWLKQVEGAWSSTSDPWLTIMADCGERLHDWRERYIGDLMPHVQACAANVTPMATESLIGEYRRGWPTHLALGAALKAVATQDRQRGFTTVGPHRADWCWHWGQHVVFQTLSQGQQKAAAIVIKLAQVKHLCADTPATVVVTLDDVCAELDQGHRQSMGAVLADLGVQCLVTGILPRDIEDLMAAFPGRDIHLTAPLVEDMAQEASSALLEGQADHV